MTLMRVAALNGHVLTYNSDDVENLHIEQPHDVHDVTKPEDTAVHRELGQARLVLSIDFKPGTDARWVDRATAALPDLRSAGDFLIAALDAEEIHPALASRVYNRFFYGNPTGPAHPIETPQPEDEDATAEQQLPADFGTLVPHLGESQQQEAPACAP